MTLFLTTRSRTNFSLFIIACVILIIVGMLFPKLASAIRPVWADSIAMTLIFTALFGLMGAAVYFQHSSPSAFDLIKAAEERIGQERLAFEEWRRIEVKLLPIKQLSWGERFVHSLLIIFGFGFILFGAKDIVSLGLPPIRIWSYVDGKYISIPTWLSGMLFITAGLICCLMSFARRTKIVDRWDEALKNLLGDGGSRQ